MLTVNLLPEGARKTTLSPIEQFHRTPLMWILAGSLLVFALALWVSMQLRQAQLQKLSEKMQTLKPKKAEVEQLRKSLQELRAQEATFRSLSQGRRRWSKRLNRLSDVTPEGVWFSEFELDRAAGLVIHGSVIGQGGPEMTRLGRLVQDLKADPDFTAAVNDIQIESVEREQDHDIEIVRFILVCSLRETAPAP